MTRYILTEKETTIILSFIKNLNIEFKGVNKNYKTERISTKYMNIEYIMNANLTIDDNNINFFETDDTLIDVDWKFKKAAIERIISETKIVNK